VISPNPPNGGRATNTDLYRALYDIQRDLVGFQQSLTERFTALDREFTCIHEGINTINQRITEHEGYPHPLPQTTNIKATGGIAGFVAAVVAAAALAVKQVLS